MSLLGEPRHTISCICLESHALYADASYPVHAYSMHRLLAAYLPTASQPDVEQSSQLIAMLTVYLPKSAYEVRSCRRQGNKAESGMPVTTSH